MFSVSCRRRRVEAAVMSSPAKWMDPAVGGTRPSTALPRVELYARKTILSTVRDDARRPWRRERVVRRLPELLVQDQSREVDERLLLVAALRTIPARQRAAVVLRYFGDLSVEETADVLGCSPGTVKSQTSRAITALRRTFVENGLHLSDPDTNHSHVLKETT